MQVVGEGRIVQEFGSQGHESAVWAPASDWAVQSTRNEILSVYPNWGTCTNVCASFNAGVPSWVIDPKCVCFGVSAGAEVCSVSLWRKPLPYMWVSVPGALLVF